MSIDIVHRYARAILYSTDAATLGEAVELAVKAKANLRGAYLEGANLRSANLRSADLRSADLEGAYLRGANLRSADLRSADLEGAYLEGANLRGANLEGANLRGANLEGANLEGANLRSAYLEGAKGLNRYLLIPLLALFDQPGRIRAYKLVNEYGEGLYNGGLCYEIGNHYEVDNANTDVNQQCGAGINVATLDWCMREWQVGYHILIAEFSAADIAAIPTATDGKFRLHRCDIVGEKDLAAIGLIEKDKEDEGGTPCQP